VFALLLGAAGAWLAVGLRKPAAVLPATAPVAAAPAVAKIEPLTQPTQPPAAADSEPAPAASASAKAASAASTKPKPHVPSPRKKGHDFGF
jgi:hypothetical protein